MENKTEDIRSEDTLNHSCHSQIFLIFRPVLQTKYSCLYLNMILMIIIAPSEFCLEPASALFVHSLVIINHFINEKFQAEEVTGNIIVLRCAVSDVLSQYPGPWRP